MLTTGLYSGSQPYHLATPVKRDAVNMIRLLHRMRIIPIATAGTASVTPLPLHPEPGPE